jgi:hypothetical protein
MPPIIGILVAALEFLGASEAAAAFLAPFILSLGASLALGAISKMFVKGPSSSSLATQVAGRTMVSRRQAGDQR